MKNMDLSYKHINGISGLDCFDAKDAWVEIQDSNGNAIGEIHYNEMKELEIVFYKHAEHIGISIVELQKIISKAILSLKESPKEKLEYLASKLHIKTNK